MQKEVKGLMILCGILFFLLVFLSTVNYRVVNTYNECVDDFNLCSKVCPGYEKGPIRGSQETQVIFNNISEEFI